MKFSVTIYRGEDPIEVEGAISPYVPASGPSWSSPGEPAEGGEVEIDTACDINGNTVTLTDDEIEEVDRLAFEQACDLNDDYHEDDY